MRRSGKKLTTKTRKNEKFLDQERSESLATHTENDQSAISRVKSATPSTAASASCLQYSTQIPPIKELLNAAGGEDLGHGYPAGSQSDEFLSKPKKSTLHSLLNESHSAAIINMGTPLRRTHSSEEVRSSGERNILLPKPGGKANGTEPSAFQSQRPTFRALTVSAMPAHGFTEGTGENPRQGANNAELLSIVQQLKKQADTTQELIKQLEQKFQTGDRGNEETENAKSNGEKREEHMPHAVGVILHSLMHSVKEELQIADLLEVRQTLMSDFHSREKRGIGGRIVEQDMKRVMSQPVTPTRSLEASETTVANTLNSWKSNYEITNKDISGVPYGMIPRRNPVMTDMHWRFRGMPPAGLGMVAIPGVHNGHGIPGLAVAPGVPRMPGMMNMPIIPNRPEMHPLAMGGDPQTTGQAALIANGGRKQFEMEIEGKLRVHKESNEKLSNIASHKKRKRRGNENLQCIRCGARDTPEWRGGPDGKRTLCNACGLSYAKAMKKQKPTAT
ncbi:hypothetical protein CANCADRAFT_42128 [Tortispora caseinolytica NRRL Y-17796]|uniref:GATA-type domain-containing protein n=1 Tax=Tortispora caseinolytica NRRL Y-17796 TaxID=767744 RepID=A0A1E4TID5_9ASCO|nr:hypothetical protein CANCADRAFT_42128 [Tortispora caseinolytica NRRL Y-17796]